MRKSEETISYEVIRSGRKTSAIEVKRDGTVVVRCPLRTADSEIGKFVEKHREWILQHRKEVLDRLEKRTVYTEAQVKEFRQHARWMLAQKTWQWARKMQVTYGKLTIRQQATRWGSCSARGNLNFNWKLVLVPEELVDYVVVHELAHRKEMNHSPGFWKIVEEQLPDYRERRKRLREYEVEIEIAEEGVEGSESLESLKR